MEEMRRASFFLSNLKFSDEKRGFDDDAVPNQKIKLTKTWIDLGISLLLPPAHYMSLKTSPFNFKPDPAKVL